MPTTGKSREKKSFSDQQLKFRMSLRLNLIVRLPKKKPTRHLGDFDFFLIFCWTGLREFGQTHNRFEQNRRTYGT